MRETVSSKVRSVLNVRGTETVKAGVGMDTGKRRNDYEAVMEDREIRRPDDDRMEQAPEGVTDAWEPP